MGMQILDKRNMLEREIVTYGDIENPLFLAKDVAEWIEHTNTSKMLSSIENDEKIKHILPITNSYTQEHGGVRGNVEVWFLTEHGLYEVLMQSRKPIAKEFKKKVKKLLKDLRLNRFNTYTNPSQQKPLSAMELLRLQYQAIEEQDQKIEEVKEDLKDFKDNAPLFNVECDEISRSVRNVGVKILGGKRSQAYRDKSVRAQIYTDIYQQLKRQFGVKSYKAIKRGQLNRALEIIDNYEAPIVLKEEIEVINSQLAIA